MPKEPITKSSSGFAQALNTNILNMATAAPVSSTAVSALSLTIAPPPDEITRGSLNGEAANIPRQLILTESADADLDSFVSDMGRAIRCRGLTTSHVMRGVIRALKHANNSILHELSKHGPQKKPSNARGFEKERDALEEKICVAIIRGIKDTNGL